MLFLQSEEKMPSLQSFVATSIFPNICPALIDLGFNLISLYGFPPCASDFIKMAMQDDFPVPLGPRIHQVIAIVTRHPEYGSLAKETLLMYEEIMSKSQLNSK
jgi:hypothetical protein